MIKQAGKQTGKHSKNKADSKTENRTENEDKNKVKLAESKNLSNRMNSSYDFQKRSENSISKSKARKTQKTDKSITTKKFYTKSPENKKGSPDPNGQKSSNIKGQTFFQTKSKKKERNRD